VLLIVDQLQELACNLEEASNKKELLSIYHQLLELSSSGLVNIVAISCNSTFLSDLLREAHHEEQLMALRQHTLKKEQFQSILKTQLQKLSSEETGLFGISKDSQRV
jgi:hypothetical protein